MADGWGQTVPVSLCKGGRIMARMTERMRRHWQDTIPTGSLNPHNLRQAAE